MEFVSAIEFSQNLVFTVPTQRSTDSDAQKLNYTCHLGGRVSQFLTLLNTQHKLRVF